MPCQFLPNPTPHAKDPCTLSLFLTNPCGRSGLNFDPAIINSAGSGNDLIALCLTRKKPLGLAWEIKLSKSRGLEPMKITILVPSSILDRASSARLVLSGGPDKNLCLA